MVLLMAGVGAGVQFETGVQFQAGVRFDSGVELGLGTGRSFRPFFCAFAGSIRRGRTRSRAGNGRHV